MNGVVLDRINYLVGSSDIIEKMADIPSKEPFADDVMYFLSEVSKALLRDVRSKQYPDVVTFAFWIRIASLKKMQDRQGFKDDNVHLGRGVAFHIAPSNVPVNFAYSLASGLLTGNANIVRVPSKGFLQVRIIVDAINGALERNEAMKPYIALLQYEREREINDLFSSIADVRIIWGGDGTIAELRKSTLPPRSTEIAFADRYSLALIDADAYLAIEDKEDVAQKFYNDTYLSDQNACTSPRIVIWTGKRKEEAKGLFWNKLHKMVRKKYTFHEIMAVNKLTSGYLAAANVDGVKIFPHEDNLIVRVNVERLTSRLMDYMDNGGYFIEYDCNNIMELRSFLSDKKCQTIAIIGEKKKLMPLIKSGIRGVDRIVEIGKTMDFNLIWDGYDLLYSLTRTICV